MALHWRPVGPEPASTYWMRRAVVLALALIPVVLAVSLLGGSPKEDTLTGVPVPPAATPEPDASVEPGASNGPSPAPPTPTAEAVAACAPEALEITATAGEARYRVGTGPRLTLSVANTGDAPCTADLGQANVELLVHSGRDRIWSSDDCAPGGEAGPRTLQPGKPEVQRVTWDGRRSRPGCTGDKERAQPGTYRVTGRVGERTVQGDVFVFTD
jgi:hypothetical protein